MIDFHSHILPAVDDGSASVEESIQLLETLAAQGVKTVIATPHFYANRHSVERFLTKRQTAYERLMGAWKEGLPEVALGAEVRYYEGISQMADLRSLCIQGTRLLLLEMPFAKWTEYVISEVVHLASSGKVTVVLAHIERYMAQQSAEVWNRLAENGVVMQASCECFTRFFVRGKAARLLKNRFIQVLGTDCHNLEKRPPNMGKALEYIEKKLGQTQLERLIARGRRLMADNALKKD